MRGVSKKEQKNYHILINVLCNIYPAMMIKTINTFVTNPTVLAILENLQEQKIGTHKTCKKGTHEAKLVLVQGPTRRIAEYYTDTINGVLN